jgi:type II secretory pathway component PulJ
MTRRQGRRSGMTLVEMLVATAATLLLMAAIAQVFGAFGTAVSDSRAMIELDGRMRSAAWRLRSDLAGATARTLPPLDPDSGDGYFEVIEGPESDTVSAGGVAKWDNAAYSVVAGSGSDDRIVGDYDDVLLFTTRSTDPPFQGRFTTSAGVRTLESPVAEVGWFLRRTVSGSTGPTDPVTFTLYRKQLLVLGYVGIDPFFSGTTLPGSSTTNAPNVSVPSNTAAMVHEYFPWSQFFGLYDVSARFERNAGMTLPNKDTTSTVSPGRLVPNTLADLTRREARFMHNVVGNTDGNGFPFGFCANWEDHNYDGILQAEEDSQPPGAPGYVGTYGAGSLPDSGHQSRDAIGEIVPDGLVFRGAREGEDVILTNVVAFDVRVFDPEAPIPLPLGQNTPLVPGDPGYGAAYLAAASLTPPSFAYGGYVDLGNGTMEPGNPPNKQVPVSRFSGYGQPRSGLRGAPTRARVWDTWSTHYETNGRDDDGDGTVDEGTDGLDSNDDGRVDETDPSVDSNGDGDFADAGEDPGETETQPPYPYPLRGFEVRIRCYEPSSRQIRQITVRHSFVSP